MQIRKRGNINKKRYKMDLHLINVYIVKKVKKAHSLVRFLRNLIPGESIYFLILFFYYVHTTCQYVEIQNGNMPTYSFSLKKKMFYLCVTWPRYLVCVIKYSFWRIMSRLNPLYYWLWLSKLPKFFPWVNPLFCTKVKFKILSHADSATILYQFFPAYINI